MEETNNASSPVTPPEDPNTEQGSVTGLEQNNAAFLAYLFSFLGGFLFFVLEKRNPYVRFAAAQSVILSAVMLLTYLIFSLTSPLLVDLTGIWGIIYNVTLLGICFVLLLFWLLPMVQALRGIQISIPVIGRLANKIIKS